MTRPDPITSRATTRHANAKPAASLTGIAIRRPATLQPQHDGAQRHDSAPVIDAQAELVPSNPAPRKVFPAAHARPPADADLDLTRIAEAPDIAPSAIIDLWEHVAADRLRPDICDFDPLTIAGQWPNSLLLRVTEVGRRPGLEVAHMFTPPVGGSTTAIPIDAMTVDWIVSLGREVVITGGPVHETDAVPTGDGPISCGVIALPFGAAAGVDHVLCHLYRVDEGVFENGIDGANSLPPRDRTGIRRLFGR